jgi:uncharacterized protein (TIGR00730 family)
MGQSRYRAVKAYNNEEFMSSTDARSLRILSEYIEPESRFREFGIQDTIIIFGSARLRSQEDAEKDLAEAKAEGGDVVAAERVLRNTKYYAATRDLAERLTHWSKNLEGSDRRFVICSGGGPGIMEAANRGASDAKGENIGLNISLPFEQHDNPYITRRLSIEFHYFFMRKFWFSYLAKAVVVMPGGFGTLDEFMEILTLVQTGKIKKRMPIVLFGKEFWNKVINFEALVEFGTISPSDLDLFLVTDSVDETFDYLTKELSKYSVEDPGPHL